MDQRRLIAFFAIAIAIMLGWQYLVPRPHPPQVAQNAAHQAAPTRSTPTGATPPPTGDVAAPGTQPVAVAPPREVPRAKIAASKLQGSVSLVGARLDDLVLKDYRETIARDSPLVRLLEPKADPQPYYVQWGWTAAPGTTVKLPGNDTQWTASGGDLTTGSNLTLSWDNGEGLTFRIVLSVDENYMFSVRQSVTNATGAPVSLFPWARVRRDYTPEVAGYYILHEGLLGVIDGRLQEVTYAKAKSEGEKHQGVAYEGSDKGGWAGITDKYWLTALIPDQAEAVDVAFNHILEDNADRYQVGFVAKDPQVVAPNGGEATMASRLFAGAKVVGLLQQYETQASVPMLSYAVDWGWFWFLTKPIFYALDWLNHILGNFGLAILVFTIFVKALFFPLANKSYKSMSKMKLLGPKMTELRERYKDDPAKLQQEMMGMYRAEKVNPASGCLPMVVQIPVFFSLYKDIFVTIEMRHAPFFGWIHDLSAVDPTNVFNLFGLLPFDPAHISPFLHLGVWPLLMGCTMFAQQRLNPPPPDPVQARMFQFMPVIFTFMLARFPAGLVIYWTWNNLLTIGQQWLIMRQTRLEGTRGGARKATGPARPAAKPPAPAGGAARAKTQAKG